MIDVWIGLPSAEEGSVRKSGAPFIRVPANADLRDKDRQADWSVKTPLEGSLLKTS